MTKKSELEIVLMSDALVLLTESFQKPGDDEEKKYLLDIKNFLILFLFRSSYTNCRKMDLMFRQYVW